jgi:hypothetical protein
MNVNKLRKYIKSGKYQVRKHTLRRLAQRGISLENTLKIIMEGEIIEDYPRDKPFPSCLVFGLIRQKPLHVVISLDEEEEMAYIITVYKPSLDKFESDYKTRRK